MPDDTALPPDPDAAPERQLIELREEVLNVEKRREVYAHATVRRERRVRTEVVQLELVTEVLVITAAPGGPAVLVDGAALAPGETREIVLYRETALPGKEVVVTQEVHLGKDRHIRPYTADVELAYEELVVNQLPTEGDPP
ncbi:stress response protein YsnF [Deinococcus metalli]|uniref:Stress response protein YsnF n=1 Tax=Deinococcus metalli TaxID=1141878 RepID=A0A7W8NPD7_9DEIO|nr:DUF2382 domain-containing protein [Deinococcus metalli]MBB5376686.1 stress response protein YsnF [Deinococcus metalli]GHF65888.1 hypothetical protein GCM10017781_47030 [Deinococcus metalli]